MIFIFESLRVPDSTVLCIIYDNLFYCYRLYTVKSIIYIIYVYNLTEPSVMRYSVINSTNIEIICLINDEKTSRESSEFAKPCFLLPYLVPSLSLTINLIQKTNKLILWNISSNVAVKDCKYFFWNYHLGGMLSCWVWCVVWCVDTVQ